ncbi:MAG TPA: metalloregulator ArsR/SmtB family transcription factor [Solirubrobacteraceae bacterium]
MPISNRDVDRLFEALADERRRAILSELVRRPGASATDLAQGAQVSRQAISKHLSALSGAGLVERRRRGRFVAYRVTPASLFAALAWMSELGSNVAKGQ